MFVLSKRSQKCPLLSRALRLVFCMYIAQRDCMSRVYVIRGVVT